MAEATISADSILQALNWRFATKSFDTSRTVSSEDLNTILEAVRLAPTSYGFQPFHVTVVSDPDTTAKLRRAAYDQEQITSASISWSFRRDRTSAIAPRTCFPPCGETEFRKKRSRNWKSSQRLPISSEQSRFPARPGPRSKRTSPSESPR